MLMLTFFVVMWLSCAFLKPCFCFFFPRGNLLPRQVLVWALVGTGVDMSAANFDTAIKETLEDVSEAGLEKCLENVWKKPSGLGEKITWIILDRVF